VVSAPSDPTGVACEWVALAPPHVVLSAVHACAHRPVALPFFHAGKRWPVGDSGREHPIADLRAVASAAARMLPSALFAATMRIGGAVSLDAFDAAVGLPEFRDAVRVRRPDLFWFVAACHMLVRAAPRVGQLALRAAAADCWVANPGTRFCACLREAARSADARFAAPGNDIRLSRQLAGAGLAVAPRDKMLVLLILLYGADYAWVGSGAPPCSPPAIIAAAAQLALPVADNTAAPARVHNNE
jgi:hypothetical protein